MVFSSSIFLFFFLPFVIAGYYLLKENYRVYFLLLASLFFYAWGEPKYAVVMLLSIAANYLFGLFIHARQKMVTGGGGGDKKPFVPYRCLQPGKPVLIQGPYLYP
jgi:D-alanyl-lipoteichoic acid acyltransferase DltB (MBOAT superfamily)